MTALDPTALESDLRSLLSSLRLSADADTCEVLADALNVYLRGIVRFRGTGAFGTGDIRALLAMWQMLLDIPRANPEGPDAYAPRSPKTTAPAEEPHQ